MPEILDKSEFDKRPNMKYHLYDPQLFAMYRECAPHLERPCYGNHANTIYSHALNINFLESIIALNRSVDPSEATLFIIPVFYNQVVIPGAPCHGQSSESLWH